MKRLICCKFILCLFLSFSYAMEIHFAGNDYIESISDYFTTEKVETTTIRRRNRQSTTEFWSGYSVKSIIDLLSESSPFTLTDYNYVFISTDRYLVRFDWDDILLYNPIIAVERNSIPLEENSYRLVALDMPAMYRIADIIRLNIVRKHLFSEPERNYSAQVIFEQMRLYTDPEPFENIHAYRFADIFRVTSIRNVGYVRLVSSDGLEQVLDYSDYLENAYLVLEEGKYSLRSTDMPSGMWIKDIGLIQTDEVKIIFSRE